MRSGLLAPLYYYSFTDAFIAMAYKSLSREQQAQKAITDVSNALGGNPYKPH